METSNLQKVTVAYEEVKNEALRRVCNPATLPFKSTQEVQQLHGTIGQARATDAIEFALSIKTKGFNLFAAGPSGVGKTSTLKSYIEHKARNEQVPNDWVYVNNFSNEDQPRAISLPPGKSKEFAKDMEDLVSSMRIEIPKSFESKDYELRKTKIANDFERERELALGQIESLAQKRGFAVEITPAGIATIPLVDGKPVSREDFSNLPEEHRKLIQTDSEAVQTDINEILSRIRDLEKSVKKELQDADREVALYAIGHLIEDLRSKYAQNQLIVSYLSEVEQDIVDNVNDFRMQEQPQTQLAALEALQKANTFDRYKVNVLVNNEDIEGAPVVMELNPSYYNLIGKTEYRSQFGMMSTDFSMIKSGALHRANGGYLILHVLDLFQNPLSWDALKRAIRSEEIVVELMGEQYRVIPATAIKPEPIPLDVKVILIGNPYVYNVLYNLDEDFRELFKVKADFNIEMEWTEEDAEKYAMYIRSMVVDNGIKDFDASGVAKLIEYGSWLAGDQKKLSTRFLEISDIASEASYWASTEGEDLVYDRHVNKAINQKTFRSNMIEAKIQEAIHRGIIMIDTKGSVVGQINGLSIIGLGDYIFGQPSRITARAYLGQRGVINIEREIALSGPTHSKGVLILANYFASMYAIDKPLSMSASLTFEQSYEGVDGDSASSTELYALLSALSQVPIKQNIAVTGSVNQLGEVQPIGGVTRKIEGFFDVCKASGLTGDQGVMIPVQNVVNLMLKQEVIDAVNEGKFHIYPVKTINQGIEILTDVKAGDRQPDGSFPEGTIHDLVNRKLRQMADTMKLYGSQYFEDKSDTSKAA